MPADFLQLAGRRIVVFGVANRKSVAWHVARVLQEADAEVIYVVRSPQRRQEVARLVPQAPVHVCDVEKQDEIDRLAETLAPQAPLHGIVHSIAFADYQSRGEAPDQSRGEASGGNRSRSRSRAADGPAATPPGIQPFHETTREQLLRTFDISCFSLIALSNALRGLLAHDASVVTVSISTTRMASENYGFMAPVKAALDSSLAFLAKSFSAFSEVRFNAVAPGLLKTSASAGIPGYVDAYLYAEAATLRRRAVQTPEAAHAAAFLLSPRSSGINAQRIVVDAGMAVNYFDRRLVAAAVEGLAGPPDAPR
jgi:enoyl-[acyl-carrier protein] reductase I